MDIQINGKVSASDAEYDLAAGADKVKIPLKLMGSELLGVYDENGRKLGADVCAAAETELSLDKSLFGAAEGDERAFYLVSTAAVAFPRPHDGYHARNFFGGYSGVR